MGNAVESLLVEIRDLLKVMAGPELAKRDAHKLTKLRAIAGSGAKKRAAILKMDGTRTRKQIIDEAEIGKSLLSDLISELKASDLVEEQNSTPVIRCVVTEALLSEGGNA